MADLTLEEVQQFIETNKETEEVTNYLGQFSKVDASKVETFLGSEDGRSINDKMNNIYLASYTKEGGGQEKIFDSKLKVAKESWEKEAGITLTPEQERIKILEDEISNGKRKEKKSDLTTKAINLLKHKGLGSMASHFIGEDEESTTNNINTINDFFDSFVNEEVEKRMKIESGRGTIGGNKTLTGSELQAKVNAAKEKAMKSFKREDRVAWKVLSAQLDAEKGGK